MARTREQINRSIENIIKKGYVPITQRAVVQEDFTTLIIEKGLKNAGKLRTLEEANKYRIKKLGKTAQTLTQEEYNAQIDELLSRWGERLTVTGEDKFQATRKDNIIEQINTITGSDIDAKTVSSQELSEAMRRADERIRQRGGGTNDFYDIVLEELGVD